MTAREAYDQIIKHVGSGQYSSWYVGITNDPSRRLFSDHGVIRASVNWAHCSTNSHQDARAAEDALLELGFSGGDGGGDDDAIYVYAYLKTGSTRE